MVLLHFLNTTCLKAKVIDLGEVPFVPFLMRRHVFDIRTGVSLPVLTLPTSAMCPSKPLGL